MPDLDPLIYVNAALYIASFLVCVAYVIKHRNIVRGVFAYKAFIAGFIAVLYVAVSLDFFVAREWFRAGWFLQGLIYLVLAYSLWGYRNGHK
jgi:hypothetical protein